MTTLLTGLKATCMVRYFDQLRFWNLILEFEPRLVINRQVVNLLSLASTADFRFKKWSGLHDSLVKFLALLWRWSTFYHYIVKWSSVHHRVVKSTRPPPIIYSLQKISCILDFSKGNLYSIYQTTLNTS